MTIWSSSLIRWRDHGRAAGRVAALQLIAFLAFLAASYPAHARTDDPQVIAVHSASAPQVSMVIATPAEQAGEDCRPRNCR